MKKIAVVLSGCGNRDGSELQETLALFLAFDRRGWQYQCFAPEGAFEVVSHIDSHLSDDDEEEGTLVDVEQRDVFEESARVCRGNLLPIDAYRPSDFDALAFPGGMGAARNISTYAFDGPRMELVDSVHDAILDTYRAHKPIVAMCIAPMLLARALGRYGIRLTLGTTDNTAAQVARQLGCSTDACGPVAVCADDEHRILTTPAYMAATRISEIFDGAEAMVSILESWLEV